MDYFEVITTLCRSCDLAPPKYHRKGYEKVGGSPKLGRSPGRRLDLGLKLLPTYRYSPSLRDPDADLGEQREAVGDRVPPTRAERPATCTRPRAERKT